MTDEAILELIHFPAKREEGFRQLVTKYQQRLYYVIRSRVHTHEDADDILQNTFMKVFSNIGSFEGRSGIFTWMYRICCNEVINYRKKNKKLAVVEIDYSNAGHAESFMDSNELYHSLESAVSILPERQQMVFRMRYFDEMPYKEIAEILQLTEGALKASFHHAVKKIEEHMKSKQIL